MNGLPKSPAAWKRLQPSSLRHALALCKDHARVVQNRSVEGIADQMGLADHWQIYKWLESGRMPLTMVRPYEAACGIDFVTRWLAGSAGKLLIDRPLGRSGDAVDVVGLNTGFAQALQLLTDFYAAPGKADPQALLDALTTHLQAVAWHRENVVRQAQPELELS